MPRSPFRPAPTFCSCCAALHFRGALPNALPALAGLRGKKAAATCRWGGLSPSELLRPLRPCPLRFSLRVPVLLLVSKTVWLDARVSVSEAVRNLGVPRRLPRAWARAPPGRLGLGAACSSGGHVPAVPVSWVPHTSAGGIVFPPRNAPFGCALPILVRD